MEFLLQQIILFFVFRTATLYCANGGNVQCVCSGNLDDYVHSDTDIHKQLFNRLDSILKIQNQMLNQWDSLLKIEKGTKVLNQTNESTNLKTELQDTPSAENKAQRVKQINTDTPSSCKKLTSAGLHSGICSIQIDAYELEPSEEFCDEELYGGGWTVILRRKDGSVDFSREWPDYKNGFGNLSGEFFIGMDKLHALTNGKYPQELIFVLEDFKNVRKFAKYSSFAIGNETERYIIKTLGNYSGDAGDSFSYHLNATFKTKELDDPCKMYPAWWHIDCYNCNLFGTYLPDGENGFGKGIIWDNFYNNSYSLKFAQMMIRPKIM